MNKIMNGRTRIIAPTLTPPPSTTEKETGINVKVELRQAVIRLARINRAKTTAERHYKRLYGDVVALYGEEEARKVVTHAYDDD